MPLTLHREFTATSVDEFSEAMIAAISLGYEKMTPSDNISRREITYIFHNSGDVARVTIKVQIEVFAHHRDVTVRNTFRGQAARNEFIEGLIEEAANRKRIKEAANRKRASIPTLWERLA